MKRFEDFLRPQGSDSDDTLAGRTSLDAFGAELTSFNTHSPNPVGELESPPEDGKRMAISRIIVIEDADYLGHARQSYLRRMLEESSSSARFIFTTHTPSRMIEALRSRTQHIRIPHPSRITIEQHLDRIFASEGLSPKPGLTGDIAHVCQGNLRKAIFMSQLLAERNLIHDRKNVQQLMANTPLRDVQFMIEEALRGRVHEWKWEEQGQKNVRVLKGAMGKFDSLSQQQSMDERDVLNRCYAFLTEGRLQFQNEMLCELLDALSRCDVRLQHSSQGRIQIESFLQDVAEIGSTYLH
jgi:DNA polymerase III delta prime subunit